MYHYQECGLDNVWLSNGYTLKETAYGKAVSIEQVDALHKLLADELVKKPGRLTGKELRFLRVHLALSQAALGQAQGVSEQNVSLWERHGKVPRANDQLLRLMVLLHHANNKALRGALDRIMAVERLVHQKIVVHAEAGRWVAEELVPDDDRFALAA